MGYEVDGDIVSLHELLSKLIDENTPKFGTYEEIFLKIHSQLMELVTEIRVKKKVYDLSKKSGITKEMMDKIRKKFVCDESFTSGTTTEYVEVGVVSSTNGKEIGRKTRGSIVKMETPYPVTRAQSKRKT